MLLILAGVSIAALMGDNGVLNNANEAKEEQVHGEVSETLMLEYADYQAEVNSEGLDSTFLDYLSNKSYVNSGTGILDVNTMSGKEMTLGNGSDGKDVYKLVQEGKYYKLYYYNEDGVAEEKEKFLISLKGVVEPENLDDWEYTIDTATNSITIVEYKGTESTEVVIPNYIEDLPVKHIGGNIWSTEISESCTDGGSGASYWYEQRTITKVVISQGIETIANNAFEYSIALESIEIPNSVTSIGTNAFASCTNLKSVELPNTLTSIGMSAFNSCKTLSTINLPSSLTDIGAHAFSWCENLETIIVPDDVTSINQSVFAYSGLKSITLPSDIEIIHDAAFSGCDDLTTVNYKGTEEEWAAITIGSQNSALTSATINCNY